ncbi:MAG: hypothetical protein LBE09_05560, partial [Christensenellaceae bacterium]|nr:hypothetical protein [Christensenellaceae bacterium]
MNRLDVNKLIYIIKSGTMIIILSLLVVLFAVACGKYESDFDISITVDGEVVDVYETYVGSTPVALMYNVNFKNNNISSQMNVFWTIDEPYHDSNLSESGVFDPGMTPGIFSIRLTITTGGKTNSKSILMLVKSRKLIGVSVTVPPRTDYIEGEIFNPDGLVVTGIFETGTSIITDYQLDMVNQPLCPTDTQITLTYYENHASAVAYIPIRVKPKTLCGIRIVTLPKITYTEGELFDCTGMSVVADYEYIYSVPITGYTVSKTSQLRTTDKTVFVDYTDGAVSKYDIVEISVQGKSLQSITVLNPPKTLNYIEGQLFSSTGLNIRANYEYTSQIVSDYTIDKVNPLVPTDSVVNISYTENGKIETAVIYINVAPKTLQSITVKSLPSKTEYIEGDIFSSSGMVVIANYEYISHEVTDYTLDKTTQLSLTDTKIRITYSNNLVVKYVDIDIKIMPKTLQRITVTELPEKTEYVEGEYFYATGLKVLAVYEFLSFEITDNIKFENVSALMLGSESFKILYTDNGITVSENIKL